MTISDDRRVVEERPVGSLTGLTPEAAKEFHGIFLISFIVFTIIAIVAHVAAIRRADRATSRRASERATTIAVACASPLGTTNESMAIWTAT